MHGDPLPTFDHDAPIYCPIYPSAVSAYHTINPTTHPSTSTYSFDFLPLADPHAHYSDTYYTADNPTNPTQAMSLSDYPPTTISNDPTTSSIFNALRVTPLTPSTMSHTGSMTSFTSYASASTGNPSQQGHPNAKVDLKKMRSYPKDVQKVLEFAKRLFLANSCSLGLFFTWKDSPNKSDVHMYASEALAQAKFELDCSMHLFLDLQLER